MMRRCIEKDTSMKIYTKTGDNGTTSLFGGRRVSKADARVDAYGTLDEANSLIGLARSLGLDDRSDEVAEQVQRDLFTLGAEVASGRNAAKKLGMPLVGEQDVARLESAIDEAEQGLEPLTSFILPGGTSAAAAMHAARTVVRRAERALVSLSAHDDVRKEVMEYINRLGDLFFVLARKANHVSNQPDVRWLPAKG